MVRNAASLTAQPVPKTPPKRCKAKWFLPHATGVAGLKDHLVVVAAQVHRGGRGAGLHGHHHVGEVHRLVEAVEEGLNQPRGCTT